MSPGALTPTGRRGWVVFAAASLSCVALSLVLVRLTENEYVFYAGYTVLQFVVLATAWNILGGYAGYVNFGSGAFLAMGAYTGVALAKAFGASLPWMMFGGALTTGLLGLAAGLMTLRLRGVFFSIATVAIAVVCETAVTNWEFVGGARGMPVLQPDAPGVFGSYTRFLFVVMLVLAVCAVAVARYVETSWIGRGLRALRDNEEAAESLGVPTLRLKLFAATLSGALMGAAGAPFAYAMRFIEPASAFSLNTAVSALAMPIVGGMSHWSGPVLGALLLGTVQQLVTVTISSELNVLAVGALLVVFVVLVPEGLLGLGARLTGKRPAR